MLLASMKLGKDAAPEALDHIYRAQANDAYWHGVFGGLYLPHLRFSVYEHILKAEAIVEEAGRGSEVNIIVADINADTYEEVEVSCSELNLYISPRHGGSIFEIDFKPKAVNITNTLSRWYEGYHEKLKAAGDNAEDGDGAKSIHGAVVMKEEGLAERLAFDNVRRSSLRERFLPAGADLDGLVASDCGELGDFFDNEYSCEVGDAALTLTRDGLLDGRPLRVSKMLCFDNAGGFSASYELTGELDDSLKGAVMGGVESLVIADEYSKVRAGFELSRPVTLWRYPVETVSLSEAGFERNYQGSSIVFLVPIEELIGNSDKFTITLKVESI